MPTKKRDTQKRKVYKFQREINKGKRFSNIQEAQAFSDFYFDLIESFLIQVYPTRQLLQKPEVARPHSNRKKSIYSPRRNQIICRYERLYPRVVLHELCHALNKYINGKGKLRNYGASHGTEYATIFVFALIVWACETNKNINVWYLADKSGVKYDDAIVKQLFNHYQDYCDIKEI
jgi:hypothetical protein